MIMLPIGEARLLNESTQGVQDKQEIDAINFIAPYEDKMFNIRLSNDELDTLVLRGLERQKNNKAKYVYDFIVKLN